MNARILLSTVVVAATLIGACSADVSSPQRDAGESNTTGTDAGSNPGDSDAGMNADPDAGTSGDPDAGEPDAGSPCEPFGRFPAPENTFTLPGPNSTGAMYIPDLQATFPEVDWATLDRLYIPAGTYRFINLGNLPDREPSRPLVITNLGGQVKMFPPEGSSQGYIWAITGGSNWVITGRYDPEAQTGHADFPGHACGDYANSRGRYGFLSDDAYRNAGHMGLGINDATKFELEYLELTRSGFAGLRVNQPKNPDGTVSPLEDVRIHDLYIHDTRSEAIYFGSTQAPPTPLAINLKVYNNRLVRSGTEALQVQNLGPGTEIHHNVMAFGAIDWRAAFQQFQDNNSQAGFRQGTIKLHHNVFLGGARALASVFSSPEGTDPGRQVEFTDNYFADGLNIGVYLGGTAGTDSSFLFARNAFRGMEFGYDSLDPNATDYGVILRFGADIDAPVQLVDNEWEGTKKLVAGLNGGDGAVGAITATGNVNGPVPAIQFVQSGYPEGAPTRRLEMWTDVATLAPGQPPVTYPVGALVMHDAELYEALVENTNQVPPENPATWKKLPLPVDDLRTAPGTVWAERGVGLLR